MLAGACLFAWEQLQSARASSQAYLAGMTVPEPNHSPEEPAAPQTAPGAQPAPQETPEVLEPVTLPPDRDRMKRDPEYNRRVMQHPAYRATQIEHRKMFTRHALRDMWDWVPMSEQTFDRFSQLEAEYAMGPPQGDGDQAWEEWHQSYDRNLARLFGADYPQYQAYMDATYSRMRITAMNRQLSAVEAIPKDRIKAVALAMTKAGQDTVRTLQAAWGLAELDEFGSGLAPERSIELARRKVEATRAAVFPLLSEKQRELLDENLKADLASIEASARRGADPP
jgi:hypothetical protein